MHKAWERLGNGDTAVLLIHGIVGTPRHFDFLRDSFPADWTLKAILLDGHGGSVADFAHTSCDKWKTQVETALAELCARYRRVYIVAHSLGTLLALDVHTPFREHIAGMLLLAVPLHIRLLPRAPYYSFHVIFDRVKQHDPAMVAYKNAYGVEPDGRLWRYLAWIPRYLELFALSRRVRRGIAHTAVPCIAFQSGHDEMVSPRSEAALRRSDRIHVEILGTAAHHYYPDADAARLREAVRTLEVTMP